MIVLITGATGGFGSVLGDLLVSEGMNVYGTSRTASTSGNFPILQMETTDEESVSNCVDEVVDREGHIDVVVNCINEMFIGSIEEETVAEVQGMYDTNVFGALRVAKKVVPLMKERGAGTIINMSSMGGILAIPYMSAYTSSKFALEAMTEALYHEVNGDGIEVVIMQPVAMHMDRPATGAHLRKVNAVESDSASARMVDFMAKDTAASKLTPEMVAKKVLQVIRSKRKPLRVPMDRAKKFGFIKRIAPQFVINKLLNGLVKELNSGTESARA